MPRIPSSAIHAQVAGRSNEWLASCSPLPIPFVAPTSSEITMSTIDRDSAIRRPEQIFGSVAGKMMPNSLLTRGIPNARAVSTWTSSMDWAPWMMFSSTGHTTPNTIVASCTGVPSWADARIGDQSPSGHTHGQILAGQARREVVDTMAASMLAVAGDLSVHSPFRRSTENTLAIFRTLAELDEAVPEPDRPATVAEAFGSRQLLHMMRLRLTGTFLRMLDAELAAGNHTPAIREQHRMLTGRFAAWFGEAEAESPGPPVELRKLVAVQLGAILTAAERVTSGELL